MPEMKAAVIHKSGPPEVLRIERWPIPKPDRGEVLIRVKAFGLNRSELFTRQGHSAGVRFPRVLGIEAVGLVEEAPGGEFSPGEPVATAMGGMGRKFDGGYAEYTCVPARQVQRIRTDVSWEILGAVPEMLQTAWGSLQVASSRKGRKTSYPRRHDVSWHGCGSNRKEPWRLCRFDKPQARSRSVAPFLRSGSGVHRHRLHRC